MISDTMGHFAQTVHLYYIKISTISKQTKKKLPLEPYHQGGPLGASKMISKPMVRLVQTVHLSYTDTNTVSKWTEKRFNMTHVT
jgi:hypothetical protein